MPNASNTQYQALYRACMKEAAAQGRELMQHLVARARVSIPQAALKLPDARERSFITEAARILMKHEDALCDAYPQALLTEFAHAIAGDTRRPGALSFDSLERLADDQLHEGIELARTQHQVLKAVQPELTELHALVCAAQGVPEMAVERNPLRPEVYVRSLRTVALQSPVSQPVRMLWMQHLGEALARELARTYTQLSVMLREGGVARGAPAPAPTDAPAVDMTVLNVRELRRLLAGELDPQGVAAARPDAAQPTDFTMTMPAAYEVLEEMRKVDQVMQRLQQRQAAGVIDAATGATALREELRKQARGPGQILGLEVVNLMVENIASDTRLLAPVQQAVRDLEPALLRLAMTDPRFFSDRKHPARQLLEQMTQRSLAWTSAQEEGFAEFMEPLGQAVDALLATRAPGSEPFDFALRLLENAWGESQKVDSRRREKAVRVLVQAEQRNLLADRIALELRQRADVAGAPREVQQFVVGPWAQVMAQARLADQSGATDPAGYSDVVSDLILSVQPRLGPGNAARLKRLVPPMLEKLGVGLASIDYPPAQTERFLAQLAVLHEQAVMPPAEGLRAPPPSAVLTREELESRFVDGGPSGAWLAPAEARHSSFLESNPSSGSDSFFNDTRPLGGLSPALPQASLRPGAWVELYQHGGWTRFQLTWASPHGTLFMFTSAAGKTQSMSRYLLDRMLQSGTLHMVSGQAVVDGALDAVAQAAARNSWR